MEGKKLVRQGKGMAPVAGRSRLASWEGREVDKTPGHSQHLLFSISGAGSQQCGLYIRAFLVTLPISHLFFPGLII